MVCKHEWRYQCSDDMGGEYYYCIYCLAEASVTYGNLITIKERK